MQRFFRIHILFLELFLISEMYVHATQVHADEIEVCLKNE